MIQSSSLLALTYTSLSICVFALVITSVLLREQQRLADTNAAVAVSLVTPCCKVLLTDDI
jgi:hypothetical protein